MSNKTWFFVFAAISLMAFAACDDSGSESDPGDTDKSEAEQNLEQDAAEENPVDGDAMDGDPESHPDGDAAETDEETLTDGDASEADGDAEPDINPDGDVTPDGDVAEDEKDAPPDGDAAENDADPDGNADGDATENESETEAETEPDGEAPLFPEKFLNQTLSWKTCPLYEDPGVSDAEGECADIVAPVYWNEPDGQTLTLKVKRLKGSPSAVRQIWMLEGGPGGSGIADFSSFMEYLNSLDPDMDIYVPDHRGVGYSTRMGCPEQETDGSDAGVYVSGAEWSACWNYVQNEWGYPLDAFTTTEAAKDLALLVELVKEENKSRIVYGVSYGTYWAHRYAQIFPHQADGIVLDSIAPSDGIFFDEFDRRGNAVMKQLFDLCKDDPICSSHLGDDPWKAANDALQAFKNGACPALADAGVSFQQIQNLTYTLGRSWASREMLPALFRRLMRCESGDVRAVYLASQTVTYPIYNPSAAAIMQSGLLFYNVGLSEFMNETPISLPDLLAEEDTMLSTPRASVGLVSSYASWPRYEWDDYVRGWASPDVPMLMLNGTLDLQTPIDVASLVKDHLNGPNQYFVTIPWANHGVIGQSPVQTPSAPPCGMQIILDYVKHPLQEPDTSCLSDLLPVTFSDNYGYGRAYFANEDLYDNPKPAFSCAAPESYFDASAMGDSYLSFSVKGPITSRLSAFQTAFSWTDHHLDGSPRLADSMYSYMERRVSSGQTLILAVTLGELKHWTVNHYKLLLSQAAVSENTLNQMKTDGKTTLALTGDVPGYYTTSVMELEIKISGGSQYQRYCPLAITDREQYEGSSLFMCLDNNTDFAVGEEFQMAGLTRLTTDRERVKAAYGLTDEDCVCGSITCAQFEELVPDPDPYQGVVGKRKSPSPAPPMPRLPLVVGP